MAIKKPKTKSADLSAHDAAIRLAREIGSRSLNEADTRHQIIDAVLHDVLSWPRTFTKCESYISPGFADYCLIRSDETNIILIEAKREGLFFALPHSTPADSNPKYIPVKTLLTDQNIKDALLQVQQYCVNIGCQFAGITNGHEWIIFRTFQANQDWRNIQAFVIQNLNYFSQHFTDAANKLGYRAIAEEGSLAHLVGIFPQENRQAYYPKTRVTAYDAEINTNLYSPKLRRVVDKYFDKLDETDADFISACYVTDQHYKSAFKSARDRLRDSLTPYLAQYEVRQIAKRLEKAEVFLTYLDQEEKREMDTYSISQWPRMVPEIRERFNHEKQEVVRSAARQRYLRQHPVEH